MANESFETVKACISYGSIDNAASEAGYVAKRMNTYANNLENSIYNKLKNYSGEHTSNVNDAKSSVSSKISSLRDSATAYSTYKSDLQDLRDKCENVDKAVKGRVSSLTATFKENNGIKNNVVQNTLNYWLTSAGNSTSVGRWLNDKRRADVAKRDEIKQSIKTWFNYEGGKELLTGIAVGLLEITIAVAGVVAAIATGGALIVVIAAVVGGVIAAVNGIANIVNEGRAYCSTQAGDPATARRQSDMNSVQDTIRAESSSAGWHAFATGLDVTEMVCAVVGLVDGVSELLKKGYKWTTGSLRDLDDIKLKDILTKDNFKSFGSKLKTEIGTSVSKGWTEIKSAFRSGDFTKIKDFAIDFGDDFMNNLKDSYLSFDDLEAKAGTIETWGDTLKGCLEDGIFKTVVGSVVLPNVNVTEVHTLDLEIRDDGSRHWSLDDDGVSIDDIKSVFSDIKDDIVGSDSWGGIGGLVDVLSTRSEINVTIPPVSIPPIYVSIPKVEIGDIHISTPNIKVPEIKIKEVAFA